ncbi:hypothetical protein EG68_01719 [Paragonimus skrjabini miyazakii]|uniref:Uncharacterized protein n=1 Tax=Paragonimus skrjabini miyazakii TaxID=59628 RepID=A0A8S9Z7D9_9TREM|nr:hypothetical protein EG68_01719 [Paragonimus skrjabini miyazakii]
MAKLRTLLNVMSSSTNNEPCAPRSFRCYGNFTKNVWKLLAGVYLRLTKLPNLELLRHSSVLANRLVFHHEINGRIQWVCTGWAYWPKFARTRRYVAYAVNHEWKHKLYPQQQLCTFSSFHL